MNELVKISKKYGIPLVEDAAEALGSIYYGKKAGKFGIGSVFSFHRTKTVTTGEGGMLILDNKNLYERCMFLRDHGRRPKGKPYYNYEITYKYIPSNIQAALGYAQFKRLDQLIAKKRRIFKKYKQNLKDIKGLQFNAESKGVFNSVWVTGIVFDKKLKMTKEKAMRKMAELGIPTRPFFYPLSSLPAYSWMNKNYKDRNPIAYDISNRGINLACAFNLTTSQIKEITNGIKKILKN